MLRIVSSLFAREGRGVCRRLKMEGIAHMLFVATIETLDGRHDEAPETPLHEAQA